MWRMTQAYPALPLRMFFLKCPIYIKMLLFVSSAMVTYAHKETIKQAWLS
jgi:hypothetical protein